MATSPSPLYEVYLHAEHEEEERWVSPVEARAEESASASTDGFVVENAKSRTAMRLARRAARGAGGLAVRAARASLKLAGAPAPAGADEDSRRPVLAASARGAELAVAVGGVVRAFRDEDDFQRLLAAWNAPRASGRGVADQTDSARDDACVVSLAWAADGSAFAAATRGGDVHVVSRLGDVLHTQTRGDRRSRAPPAACVLALAPHPDGGDGGADTRDVSGAIGEQSGANVTETPFCRRDTTEAKRYDLLVITRACDGGARACAHVQRVSAGGDARDARREPRVTSRRLEGAPFAFVTGAAWHEPSRTLAVVGESRRDASVGSRASGASAPGAGLWRFARGELARAAAPVPPRRVTAAGGGDPNPKPKPNGGSAVARFAAATSLGKHTICTYFRYFWYSF